MERFGNDYCSAYLGDCLEVLDIIPDRSVNLVFADPPYNIGKRFGELHDRWPSEQAYFEWCTCWLDLCVKKLSPDGTLYFMTSTQAMPFIDLWLRKRLHILSRIVWHYDSSGVQAKRYFGSLYEPLIHCVLDPKRYTFNGADIEVEAKTGSTRNLIDYRNGKSKPYSKTKVPGNAWYIPRVRYRMGEYEEHPTQKPEALLERIIRASSNKGDCVLDPFAGTFTTGAVAQRLSRNFIGIELDEGFFQIGLRRLGLATHYRGRLLSRPIKSYERSKPVDFNKVEPSLFGRT